jgi:hypothetical protein
MELLSSQLKSSSSPINLVLHSPLSYNDGGDAKDTPTYKIIPLPFASDEDFHEYRFGKPNIRSFVLMVAWLTMNFFFYRLATG